MAMSGPAFRDHSSVDEQTPQSDSLLNRIADGKESHVPAHWFNEPRRIRSTLTLERGTPRSRRRDRETGTSSMPPKAPHAPCDGSPPPSSSLLILDKPNPVQSHPPPLLLIRARPKRSRNLLPHQPQINPKLSPVMNHVIQETSSGKPSYRVVWSTTFPCFISVNASSNVSSLVDLQRLHQTAQPCPRTQPQDPP